MADTKYPRNLSVQREQMFALAEYYAWCARKGHVLPGNDPRTGRPWSSVPGGLGRQLGRASYVALAREAFANARKYAPTPGSR